MRIIAGKLSGRQFKSPPGYRTHPMSDKARGALFNALGDINGLTVLDAFAGSGALSFEAISRGASHVTAIDNDRHAQQIIAANIKELGLQQKVKLIKAPASAWISTSKENFDLVLLDPPFKEPQLELLNKLAARTKTGSLVVFSLPPEINIRLDSAYEHLTTKAYGDNQLLFFRNLSTNQ